MTNDDRGLLVEPEVGVHGRKKPANLRNVYIYYDMNKLYHTQYLTRVYLKMTLAFILQNMTA